MAPADKIRLGFIVGKTFDPILQGTQDRDYPEEHKIMNNSGPRAGGWGGQFHIDVSIAWRLGKMHPDLYEVDIIKPHEVNPNRLSSNHLNFNMWHDLGAASLGGDKVHIKECRQAFSSAKSRMWPTWDVQEWIYHKSWYMQALEKVGIPIIPSIYLNNGFNHKQVMKEVLAKGWKNFFIKPGYLALFGKGTWRGKTQDCIDDPTLLQKYENGDGKIYTEFLVQPYMLKPDGDVFDEIRNFFIEGEWSYSVFTHGTDDDKVWTQPEGALKERVKKLATKAYREYLKVSKWWDGKLFLPPITRVDVGIIPSAKENAPEKLFINEIEWDQCTLLARYAGFNLRDRMCEVYDRKIHELLTRLLDAGAKVPDAKMVRSKLGELADRLGLSTEGDSRKRASADGNAPNAKRGKTGA